MQSDAARLLFHFRLMQPRVMPSMQLPKTMKLLLKSSTNAHWQLIINLAAAPYNSMMVA
jgi:hypothetical protein